MAEGIHSVARHTIYFNEGIHAVIVDGYLLALIQDGLISFSPRIVVDPNHVGEFLPAMAIELREARPIDG